MMHCPWKSLLFRIYEKTMPLTSVIRRLDLMQGQREHDQIKAVEDQVDPDKQADHPEPGNGPLSEDENPEDSRDDTVQNPPPRALQVDHQRRNDLVDPQNNEEHRHDHGDGFGAGYGFRQQQEPDDPEENPHQQMKEEAAPGSHHEGQDDFDNGSEDKQPSEENHGDHRGLSGPDNGEDAEDGQADPKGQEP